MCLTALQAEATDSNETTQLQDYVQYEYNYIIPLRYERK